MALIVEEVKDDKKKLKAFLELPFRLYRDDPLWVPPLKSEVASFFTGKHPFCEHSEITAFIATQGKETLGRVAAIMDRNFITYHQKPIGYFGFFESVNSKEVTLRLFERVEDVLRKKGIKEIIGPMNPSTNYECGLLIEGFSTPPYIMMPHNPPFYQELLESVGFKKAKDLLANLLIGDGSLPQRLERIASRISSKIPEVKIREVDLKNIQREIREFMRIYNEAWANNWGFVPMSEKEVSYFAKVLKSILVPSLALFAEYKEEPAGFILALPNYNHVLKVLKGKLTSWGLLRALWVKGRIKEIRIPLFGIRPKYRLKGIDTLLYLEVFKRGWQLGYRRAELSWILEDNHLMQKAIESMGGRPYKRYRIYWKEI
jgi:GNAT superfamily N-acetyltransferase